MACGCRERLTTEMLEGEHEEVVLKGCASMRARHQQQRMCYSCGLISLFTIPGTKHIFCYNKDQYHQTVFVVLFPGTTINECYTEQSYLVG